MASTNLPTMCTPFVTGSLIKLKYSYFSDRNLAQEGKPAQPWAASVSRAISGVRPFFEIQPLDGALNKHVGEDLSATSCPPTSPQPLHRHTGKVELLLPAQEFLTSMPKAFPGTLAPTPQSLPREVQGAHVWEEQWASSHLPFSGEARGDMWFVMILSF